MRILVVCASLEGGPHFLKKIFLPTAKIKMKIKPSSFPLLPQKCLL